MSDYDNAVLNEQAIAEALAERLAAVVPAWLGVRADEECVILSPSHGGASIVVMFQARRPVDEQLRILATNVLSTVQDLIAREIAEPWPALATGRGDMALPDATVRDDELLMWYGDKEAPLITLRPIALKDITVQP